MFAMRRLPGFAVLFVLLILSASCCDLFNCDDCRKCPICSECLDGILSDCCNLRWGIIGDEGTLLDKHYFVINHHDAERIPYWVGYHLADYHLDGTAESGDYYEPDPELPPGARAELDDYESEGYDRGHNAPTADFNRNEEALQLTYLLSNISPQTTKLNRGRWNVLEGEVRELVKDLGEVWIFTGNITMNADSQSVGATMFIGDNAVAVPTHLFKAILGKSAGGEFSMYAFLLPNTSDDIPGPSTNYLMTVDRLEEITGYNFFPLLEDAIENLLERSPGTSWPKIVPGEPGPIV